ncbi:MAG: hypothetical protein QOI61_645 [Actinomycetota bacterium]|jgi:hypothetical protein
MTTTTAEPTTAEPAAPRLYWWRELLTIGVFYGVYTMVRNFGISSDSTVAALRHAKQVIRIEEALSSFHEKSIQDAFIHSRWFIQFWDVFYGSAHFIVTIIAIVLMFRRAPERYPIWRNTLAVTVALALLGFTLYPLMPPRLLDMHGLHYGFVDTLQKVGGLWSFDSGAMSKISNQYAAMPSLHFAWSTWCACVLVPMIKPLWGKILMAGYPAITVFCIVVTANHYWIDAVGGGVALGLGYLIGGKFITGLVNRRTAARAV